MMSRAEQLKEKGFNNVKRLSYWVGELVNQDKDFVICIDGKERTGKSSLAFWMGKFISERTGQKFDFNNYTWSSLNLINKMWYELGERSVIVNDETGLDQYKMRSTSKANVITDQAMMISGLKNDVIILCAPNMWDLSQFSRERRIELWIRVSYHMEGAKIHRGFAEVNSNLIQTKYGVKPFWKRQFQMYFPDIPAVEKKVYKAKKAAATFERIQGLLEEKKDDKVGNFKGEMTKNFIKVANDKGLLTGRNKLTDKMIGELLGVSKSTVYGAKKEVLD